MICISFQASPRQPGETRYDSVMDTRWHGTVNETAWIEAALAYIGGAEAEALAARGVFHVVLAGGDTPRRVYEALATERHDWGRWQIWFGDERRLPPEHAERNSQMAWRSLLGRVAIPGTNIHVMPAELGAAKAAEGYAVNIRDVGFFDLVLLGLGEDGHTASLFPGRDWGDEFDTEVIAVFDAPKPPAERISLSASRLSRSRHVLFLVSGAGKRAALSAWRAGAPIPAAAIQPLAGVDVLMTRDAVPLDE